MSSPVAADGPQADKKPDVGCLGTIGTFLVIDLLCWLAFKACTSIGDGDSEQKNERDARITCNHLVEDQLKSPGSADVKRGSLTGHDGTYTITGDVDAENSFGGKVRASYRCEISGGTGTATVTE